MHESMTGMRSTQPPLMRSLTCMSSMRCLILLLNHHDLNDMHAFNELDVLPIPPSHPHMSSMTCMRSMSCPFPLHHPTTLNELNDMHDFNDLPTGLASTQPPLMSSMTRMSLLELPSCLASTQRAQ